MMQQEQTLDTQESGFNLAPVDILRIIGNNWYWFVLSVVVCIGGGAYYIMGQPKVYERTASVLIKVDSKGSLSESAAFEDMNMFKTVSNLDNEILMLKSKRLMREVVDKLDLDVSYSVKEQLRRKELYTTSPVKVRFPDASENQVLSLTVTPLSEKEVLLSGFPEAKETQVKAALLDTVETKAGRVVVEPTLYYEL